MKKSCLILILFFLLSLFQLSSLEIKEGRVKIVLHESNGRFSAYYLDDISKGKYIPFFLEQDPRTTVLSILVGNNVDYMGDSFGYRQSAKETDDGAQFTWVSSKLTVTESFSFISSENAALSDGFKISINIKNNSEEDLRIGVCYLFDTHLGEKNQHFIIDSSRVLSRETEYSSSLPEYWISPSTGTDTAGLQMMVKSEGITAPHRIIFANWKRLNDSLWNYNINTSRNFNLLPYSINDSAAGIYYPIETVSKGSSRELIMAMGSFSESGFKGVEKSGDDGISTIFEQTVSTENPSDNQQTAVKTDLITVKDLLAQIDKILASDKEVTDEELKLLAQIIENLKSRKNLYED